MEPVQLSQVPDAVNSTELPIPDGIGADHVDHAPLYDRFGAKPGSPGTDRQLAMIWEWARENSPLKDDKNAILWEVTKLHNRLGSASFNSKPWVNLATYVSTWKQQRDLENRLKEMVSHK